MFKRFVKVFVLVVCFAFLSTVHARDSFDSTNSFNFFGSMPSMDSKVRGVLALRGNMQHLNKDVVIRLVGEAREVVKDDPWMPVQVLLGQAINETDLRWWLRRGYDCGISQNRVTIFKGGEQSRKDLCMKLSKSSKKSFEYAMKEFRRYRGRYCKHNDKSMDQLRCLLNIYYQGPKWLWKERKTCELPRPEWFTDAQYNKRVRRCRFRNRYWLRVLCFARGIELGRPPLSKGGKIISCRRAMSLNWIESVYSEKRFNMHEKRIARRLNNRYK